MDMEKLNGNSKFSKLKPEDHKKILAMLDSLKDEGYDFEVEETPDEFHIRLKDAKGKEKTMGFTKVNLGQVLMEVRNPKHLTERALIELMEAKIRFPELGTELGLMALAEMRKLKEQENGD